MDEHTLHQWFIDCFGPVQGEMAWKQVEALPEQIREQLMSQSPEDLPDPSQIRGMMQAFAGGGLNSFGEMQQTIEEGPINVKLAKSIALQQANDAESERSVTAEEGNAMRRAMSEVNLWLDTATDFNPVTEKAEALTRAAWVEGTIDQWAQFAAPVASSMNEALSAVISERLGDAFDGEITGMFAGPVPIPIPEGMKDPRQLMKLFANTSYAMQLGQAAGAMSKEVRGSYDQGIELLKNPAGGLIMQNVDEYAQSLEIDASEVTEFIALREQAYARLYVTVPWLMPRFTALIGKYARGITIDLDAMEEQLRGASSFDPESLSGAVNLSNVGLTTTDEQKETMHSIETILALVEGWVECVTWRAGMAHLPHLEQLREMMRRERAVGGPAELTFENLLGLQLRPKRTREAAQLWEHITAEQGIEARDAMWGHPDLLPALPDEHDDDAQAAKPQREHIDWDAELSKLLDDDADTGGETGADGTDGAQPDGGTAPDAKDTPDVPDVPDVPDTPDRPDDEQ
ncbi:zinc-dependent metalloprotease [Bifidobacterium criceti]|uniref:Hydrolase n=1 Tax=Bifidobacterium criceti TaxID=1960969 RepID=A0A2A2EF00_9BIFI|nr:zinc-dependent metalloprotease [Bifidobacterium criceti]PAU67804.1 hydrolase [Bifidobacterium criceti]